MNNDDFYQGFELEMERKKLLYEFFEDLKKEAKAALRKMKRDFDGKFFGPTQIIKVEDGFITLKSLFATDQIMKVKVNSSISGWLKPDDQIDLVLGRYGNIWYILHVNMIGSNAPMPSLQDQFAPHEPQGPQKNWVQ